MVFGCNILQTYIVMDIDRVNEVVDRLVTSRRLLFNSKITVLTPIIRLNIIEKEKTKQKTEELIDNLLLSSLTSSSLQER